jgi:hypothetical protein
MNWNKRAHHNEMINLSTDTGFRFIYPNAMTATNLTSPKPIPPFLLKIFPKI